MRSLVDIVKDTNYENVQGKVEAMLINNRQSDVVVKATIVQFFFVIAKQWEAEGRTKKGKSRNVFRFSGSLLTKTNFFVGMNNNSFMDSLDTILTPAWRSEPVVKKSFIYNLFNETKPLDEKRVMELNEISMDQMIRDGIGSWKEFCEIYKSESVEDKVKEEEKVKKENRKEVDVLARRKKVYHKITLLKCDKCQSYGTSSDWFVHKKDGTLLCDPCSLKLT